MCRSMASVYRKWRRPTRMDSRLWEEWQWEWKEGKWWDCWDLTELGSQPPSTCWPVPNKWLSARCCWNSNTSSLRTSQSLNMSASVLRLTVSGTTSLLWNTCTCSAASRDFRGLTSKRQSTISSTLCNWPATSRPRPWTCQEATKGSCVWALPSLVALTCCSSMNPLQDWTL